MLTKGEVPTLKHSNKLKALRQFEDNNMSKPDSPPYAYRKQSMFTLGILRIKGITQSKITIDVVRLSG